MAQRKLKPTDVVYPTKWDWWLVIPLFGVSAFCLYTPFILFNEPVDSLVQIGGSIFFLILAPLFPWLFFTTRYVLTDEQLLICCAGSEYPILYESIYEVFPSHNPLSAPAFSLDRVRIKFHGMKFGALISPVDKVRFMNDLLKRCPQLMWKGKGLALRPGLSP